MSRVLPQQQLLLELMRMSGDIAVTGVAEDTILWRTLMECRAAGWIEWVQIRPGLHRASITEHGRVRAGAPPRHRAPPPGT